MWWGWIGVARATCTAGLPCVVQQVDADCAPTDVAVTAGAPLYVTASCVDAVCCAGSAESCATSYRPYAPTVTRYAGGEWVVVPVAAVEDGTCGGASRYRLVLPGGTLRIDGVERTVAGTLPQEPTPWPPGFPEWSDGLHQPQVAREGTWTTQLEAPLWEALTRAGWWVSANHGLAARDGVLVQWGPTVTWNTRDVPVGAWWDAADPCPGEAELVAREVAPQTFERACTRPDGVRDGPYTLEGPAATRRGWYSAGEPDRDWLEADGNGGYALRTYRDRVPSGEWRSASSDEASEGRFVDGARDGLWVTRRRGQNGEAVERVTWCRGVRCGAYERTDGDVVETGAYRDDRKHGRWRTTYGGVVVGEGEFVGGQPVGIHRKFGAQGQPFSVEVYDAEGRPDGIWVEYNAWGRVGKETRYVRGEVRAVREWTEEPYRHRVRQR